MIEDMKKLFLTLCLLVMAGTGYAFQPNPYLKKGKLPTQIDYNMKLDGLSMMELRLLRSYPYAKHGMWFTEYDLNAFFNARAKWYYDKCSATAERNGSSEWDPLVDYDKVKLNAQEKAFVDRVDKRIAELAKNNTVNKGGLSLANPENAVNLFQLDKVDKDLMAMLQDHNFALVPTNDEQLFNTYEQNEYQKMPSFVTTDLYLQAYHMYFGYVLKTLEKHVFTERIFKLNMEMYDRAMMSAMKAKTDEERDLYEFTAAYFAVAQKLLVGEAPTIPESYRSVAEMEIRNIMNGEDTMSPMMTKQIIFPYSLFKPRGHYTRSEEQKRYFRAMMWLQSFTFCREKVLPMKQVLTMAEVFNRIDAKTAKEGVGVYKTLDFLMGEPDNVAILEVAEYVKKHLSGKSLTELCATENVNKVNAYLVELFKTRNRIESKIAEGGCEDKINFMPQRYMADSYVLSRMFDETANSNLPFPKGLHVFSAFGSKMADEILANVYGDPKAWDGYAKEMGEMKAEMGKFSEWDKSMYNKWFECLVTLQKTDKLPDFMKTEAWQKKNLNTALASWAELRHDAILYAEQPIVAECGGGENFPDPIVVGYVEPNLPFWLKMQEMVKLTKKLLTDNGLMTEQLQTLTEDMEENMEFCVNVTKKELAGKTLTEDEYATIKSIGSSMEWFTLSVLDPDERPDSWQAVTGADRRVAVVADVFTRNVLGCQKCGILYEAVGSPDIIYVTVVLGDKVYLMRGAVLSYYEFVNPLGNRLTDEEWQSRLEKNNVPARPKWMQPLILNRKPVVNEECFYSSGC